jgi:hypothetical protein
MTFLLQRMERSQIGYATPKPTHRVIVPSVRWLSANLRGRRSRLAALVWLEATDPACREPQRKFNSQSV